MNLKEVEKQVKFNLFVTCLIYILIGLCFIVSLIAIVTTPVKAATSELRTNDISNTIRNTSDCGSQSYGYFCNNESLNDTHKEQVNSLQVGYLYSLKMDVSVNTWFTQSPSTIEIYNSNNTFRNISYTCNLTSTNSQNNISCNVVYVNAGKIIVNFNTGNYVPGELTIRATNTNSAYMNSGNYTISRLVQLQTINSDNSDVIDNANQNTTNIINNNNENTQDIIDNQNANNEVTTNAINSASWNIISQFANMCSNIFDKSKAQQGYEISGTGTAVNQNYFVSDYIPIVYGSTYTFSGKRGGTTILYYDREKNLIQRCTSGDSCASPVDNGSFTVPTNGAIYYLRFNSNLSAINTVQLQIGNTATAYCAYGTFNSNKLDGIQGAIQGGLSTVDNSINDLNDTMEDVKDLQQDTYDYMTDDTNPSVNSSDINNVISNVQVQDPLNYLLTLPLNLLTKLNTLISADSCSRVSFGSLYDTELYLPCIDFEDILGGSLWSTVDIIVGIGLLVIVIKRFYDSISNILTLGKEKEVRDKLDLPTPMEFLSMILGGGR